MQRTVLPPLPPHSPPPAPSVWPRGASCLSKRRRDATSRHAAARQLSSSTTRSSVSHYLQRLSSRLEKSWQRRGLTSPPPRPQQPTTHRPHPAPSGHTTTQATRLKTSTPYQHTGYQTQNIYTSHEARCGVGCPMLYLHWGRCASHDFGHCHQPQEAII